ncbi:hypothetical protein C5D09_14110 [Rathayibacter sp. AY1C9]|uniref:hypothetical protein n=1 Tax=Rathayibacter sp. AY1C9 TaxID=2080541 RepID=UPI000CE90B85|nr:hypothetical protein [Rathayibacter sp. AY1C9]PPH44156.1 hypothetical protein C5D09_14110 [Rathayibacter sp. AY1C9]
MVGASSTRTAAVRLGAAGTVHYIDSDEYRIDNHRETSAHTRIVEGVFEAPGSSPVHVAVKLADGDGQARSELRNEARAYRWIESHGPGTIPVLRMFGHAKRRDQDVLVIERALFSLDALLVARPSSKTDELAQTVDRFSTELIMTMSTLAAATIAKTLRALNDLDASSRQAAHGDLRLENLLAVERDGVITVVVGDWGSSTLSRRSASTPPSSDLASGGLALWELLHAGHVPMRSGSGRPLRRDDPTVPSSDDARLTDFDDCNQTGMCAVHSQGAGQTSETSDAHELAREMILRGAQEGDDAEYLWSPALDAAVLAGDDVASGQGTLRARTFPWQGLAREMAFTDVGRAAANLRDGGWMPLPPPPLGVFGFEEGKARRSRNAREVLRKMFSPHSLFQSSGAIAAGIIVGIALIVLVRLPSAELQVPRDELVHSLVVAIGATAVGIVASVVAWYAGRGIPRSRRSGVLARWSPLAGVVAFLAVWMTISLWSSTSLWAPPQLSSVVGPRGEIVGLAAAVAAASVNALIVTLVDRYSSVSRHRSLWNTTASAATAVATIAVVSLTALSVVPAPMASVSVAASLDTISAGLSGSEPLFLNPEDLAVADDGTLGLLERYSDEVDVVWIKEPRSSWTPRVRVPHNRPDDPLPAGLGEEEPSTSLVDLLALPGSAVPSGDRITSVGAFDFVSPERLAVIGNEGISVIDLTEEGPVARTVDAGVRVGQEATYTEVVSVGDDLLVDGFDQAQFTSIHPDRLNEWASLPACSDSDQNEGIEPDIVRVSNLSADSAKISPLRWTSPAGDCRRNTWHIVDGPDGPAVIERTHDAVEYFLTLRPLDDRPAQRLMDERFGFGEAVAADGRMIVNIAGCLMGFALPDATLPLPTVAEESWYTAAPDDDECREETSSAGFIGADVRPLDEQAESSESDSGAGIPEVESTSCTPPRAGRQTLDYREWPAKPLAVDGNGTIYVVSSAAYQCTPIVWSLSKTETTWVPVGGIDSVSRVASDASVTMFASTPNVSDGGISWLGAGLSRVVEDSGSQHTMRSGPTNSYRAGNATEVAAPTATVGEMTTYDWSAITSAKLEFDANRTKIVIDRNALNEPTFEVPISATRDIALVRGAEGDSDTVILAMCDAVVSFDEAQLGADESTSGWFSPPAEAFSVLLGDPQRQVVGWSDPPECGDVVEAARDAHSDGQISVRPVAVDAVSVKGEKVVAFAEEGTFGTDRVSRIRLFDPSGVLKGGATGDVVYTIGCDDDLAYDARCDGDLSRLGLVPTDVAIRDDGAVAVSTMDSSGWGPVLLFQSGQRRVVRLEPDVLATGVAWDDDRLIVTDGRRGEVLALELSQ